MRTWSPCGLVKSFSPQDGPVAVTARAGSASRPNSARSAPAVATLVTSRRFTVRLLAAWLLGGCTSQVKYSQEGLRDGGGRVHHDVASPLVLGKRDNPPEILFPTREHDDPVDPQRHPAVGRGAILERPHEEAEAVLDLLGRHAQHLEDLALQFGFVNADRTRPELPAIENHVIVLRAHLPRIGVD